MNRMLYTMGIHNMLQDLGDSEPDLNRRDLSEVDKFLFGESALSGLISNEASFYMQSSRLVLAFLRNLRRLRGTAYRSKVNFAPYE